MARPERPVQGFSAAAGHHRLCSGPAAGRPRTRSRQRRRRRAAASVASDPCSGARSRRNSRPAPLPLRFPNPSLPGRPRLLFAGSCDHHMCARFFSRFPHVFCSRVVKFVWLIPVIILRRLFRQLPVAHGPGAVHAASRRKRQRAVAGRPPRQFAGGTAGGRGRFFDTSFRFVFC